MHGAGATLGWAPMLRDSGWRAIPPTVGCPPPVVQMAHVSGFNVAGYPSTRLCASPSSVVQRRLPGPIPSLDLLCACDAFHTDRPAA